MKLLDQYFTTDYLIRLAGLRQRVMTRRPDPENHTEDELKEYAGWLQKELDFFFVGTHNQLQHHVGTLDNLSDKRHKLMASAAFVNSYLLGEITDQQIKDMFGGAKVSTAGLDS